MLTFLLLYALMSRIALPRIGSIFAERSKRISDDLAAANRFKEQSEAANAAYQKSLADARTRAQGIANATREEQAAQAAATNKRLEAQLHEKLAAAEQSIAATRTAAMGNVDSIAAETASAIVERLIGTAPAHQTSPPPSPQWQAIEAAIMLEAEAWVAIAFVLFLGLLVYMGAHRRVITAIDARQARIKAELDEAVRLRQEAQAVLAEFERKGREAEGEAAAIVAAAKAEAERLAVEAKARMEDFVVRRTKMAEAKIAQAEAQALADVRAAAADTAVAAAEKILGTAAKGKVAEDLLARVSKTSATSSIDAAPRPPHPEEFVDRQA